MSSQTELSSSMWCNVTSVSVQEVADEKSCVMWKAVAVVVDFERKTIEKRDSSFSLVVKKSWERLLAAMDLSFADEK